MTVKSETLARLAVSFVREAKGVAEYRLDANGLKILLVERHFAPVVTTMIMYRVGSRNEAVGTTGSTHFLEHMMFKSTDKHDHAKGQGLDDVFKPIGANYNATTSEDRTNYYEMVPREHMRLCIAIEADRMRNLRLLDEERASEMTVVRSEFEISENSPHEVLETEVRALAYREHPYHHPVLGWRADVENVPLSKLHEFYQTYYWPNNATLILVGDFEAEDALAAIVDQFGKIPVSPHPIPTVYTVEPEQEGMRRLVLRRAGDDLALVHMAFPIPQAAHADYVPTAVAGDILGSGRSSRLYKALVEAHLASDIMVRAPQNRDPGLFNVLASVVPGVEPAKVEAVIVEELNKLAANGVTAEELARVKSAAHNLLLIQRDDQSSVAEELCEGEAVVDWLWAVNYDDTYQAVTGADIQRVAGKYFVEDHLTVGHYLPRSTAQEDEEDLAHDESTDHAEGAAMEVEVEETVAEVKAVATESGAVAEAKSETQAAHAPAVTLTAQSTDLASKVKSVTLPNGLKLLIMPIADSGVVSICGFIRAGQASGKETAAASLCGAMATRGSKRFSKDTISDRLQTMGTYLAFGAQTFTTHFRNTLAKPSLPEFVELLADVMINPTFADDELKSLKKQSVAALQAVASDPETVGSVKLLQALYKPSDAYYAKTIPAAIRDVKGIKRESLAEFHQRFWVAKNTTIVVVGDVEAQAVEQLFASHFGAWRAGEATVVDVPSVALPAAAKRIDVPMPDKASVEITIGLPAALKRTDSDYLAAKIANNALGVDTISSRLGAVVREKHGLTYGVYSSFDDPRFGHAPWTVKLSVNPDNVEKALKLVHEVLDGYLAEGISEREFTDEIGREYGTFVLRLASTSGIAEVIAALDLCGVELSFMDKLNGELRSLTREQVNAAMRKYFRTDCAVTVVAGVPK